ncbi:MAG: riboflavin synthase [Betaproteobacteria bacterium]|nr:riboflavin synthase [Betaproteobacteria bacterium]MDE1989387.1 riboflavin synthase [Betaproteobacteria bacterium]
MFTGIVSAVGKIEVAKPLEAGMRLAIDAGGLDLSDVAIGDSIAVNGVCLTVVACEAPRFEVDVSAATRLVTCGLELGAAVNLEKALRLSDRLGGHLVSGHVDGVGVVQAFEPRGESWLLRIAAPGDLPRYLARKGSVTVNGVSLTVNDVQRDLFEINVIPHTRAVTTFSRLKAGDSVNLEVDLLARYAERAREWQGG